MRVFESSAQTKERPTGIISMTVNGSEIKKDYAFVYLLMRFRGLEPQPCLNHKSSPRVRKGEKEDTDFRLLSKRSGGARRGGRGG